MKIKKLYCEKNEICDVSGDYCQIEMSLDNLGMIQTLLETGKWKLPRLNGRAKALTEIIRKARENAETEWY